MRRIMLGCLPLLCIALAIGCADQGESPTASNDDDGGNPVDTLAHFTQVFALLQASCATNSTNCHGNNGASGFYMADYDAIVSHEAGINETVDPGNGAGSNLYTKTTSTPPFGQRMPLVGDPLSIDEQLLIKRWIDQGALNN